MYMLKKLIDLYLAYVVRAQILIMKVVYGDRTDHILGLYTTTPSPDLQGLLSEIGFSGMMSIFFLVCGIALLPIVGGAIVIYTIVT